MEQLPTANIVLLAENNFFFVVSMTAKGSVRIRSKKCSFFGEFAVLCFLAAPVLRFAFLPSYRRSDMVIEKFMLILKIY